jgi:hypothetical protein
MVPVVGEEGGYLGRGVPCVVVSELGQGQ